MTEQVPVKILESPNFCVGVKSEYLISKEQHLESKRLSLEKSEISGSETNKAGQSLLSDLTVSQSQTLFPTDLPASVFSNPDTTSLVSISSKENTEAGKSNKKRVRDRDTVKSDNKLCPAINRGKECSYGDKCTFTHDVHAFLSRKPKDIGLIILISLEYYNSFI